MLKDNAWILSQAHTYVFVTVHEVLILNAWASSESSDEAAITHNLDKLTQSTNVENDSDQLFDL